MNFIERAFLSLKSKIGKSFLIFITFFAIFSLIFIGFTIKEATSQNEIKARQKLGADISLALDQQKVMKKIQTGMQANSLPTISQKVIQKYSKLKQVKDYQISIDGSADKDKLKPIPATSSNNNQQVASTMMGSDGKQPSFTLNGVRKSNYDDDFKNKKNTLIQGSPITDKDDTPTALIEEQLAKKNNLKIGDYFQLKNTDNEEVKFKVKGIYRTQKSVNSMLSSIESAQPSNEIYVNYQAASDFSTQKGISKATFYLKDPLLINSFLKDSKKLNLVDSLYKFDAHDDAYQQLVGPLKQVGSICTSLVVVSLVVGLFILGAIILLNIKSRRYEMGIFLSLGESKLRIISQLLLETFIVAVIAFSLSAITSAPLGQLVANYNLNQQVQESENKSTQSQNSMAVMVGGDSDESKKKYTPIDSIKVKTSQKTVAVVSIISFFILLISTLIPSLFIMRLQPKILFQQKE